jgi:hypothetical protein
MCVCVAVGLDKTYKGFGVLVPCALSRGSQRVPLVLAWCWECVRCVGSVGGAWSAVWCVWCGVELVKGVSPLGTLATLPHIHPLASSATLAHAHALTARQTSSHFTLACMGRHGAAPGGDGTMAVVVPCARVLPLALLVHDVRLWVSSMPVSYGPKVPQGTLRYPRVCPLGYRGNTCAYTHARTHAHTRAHTPPCQPHSHPRVPPPPCVCVCVPRRAYGKVWPRPPLASGGTPLAPRP